jgi:hypothetical protein
MAVLQRVVKDIGDARRWESISHLLPLFGEDFDDDDPGRRLAVSGGTVVWH